MEQEISGLKVCRQLLLLQTLIQIRPQVVIFTGLLQRCKQWGYSTSTGEYVTHTFPIKFTVIPIVVAGALTSNTSGNTGSQSNPCYRSITVSNFVFCMYDNARGYAGSTYIAIGYQLQWGYSGYAVNFPISFDIVYNVLSIPQNTASTSNSYWGRFYITNLTKNGFTVSDTGAGSNRWLAIGKAQPQWGKPTVRGNNIFPIPFPNSALAITSAGIGGWHTVDVSIVNNNSYSVLGWATDSPSSARISLPNVIAIGF